MYRSFNGRFERVFGLPFFFNSSYTHKRCVRLCLFVYMKNCRHWTQRSHGLGLIIWRVNKLFILFLLIDGTRCKRYVCIPLSQQFLTTSVYRSHLYSCNSNNSLKCVFFFWNFLWILFGIICFGHNFYCNFVCTLIPCKPLVYGSYKI